MQKENDSPLPRLLLTGASGMLGNYVKAEFTDFEILTLGRARDNDFACDLSREVPDLEGIQFDTVIHCAGTEDNERAMQLNLDGTSNLIKGLGKHTPKHFVFISSWEVYGTIQGEDIDETHHTWTRNKTGQSKILAEGEVETWGKRHGIVTTIIRPAPMVGTGMGGWIQDMFQDVINGHYLNVRDQEARWSLVTALDVARVIHKVYQHGGIFNVADGHDRKVSELAQAMSENAGASKRQWTLPKKWVDVGCYVADWLPMKLPLFHRESLERRNTSLTFNAKKITNLLNYVFHDAVEVIARKDSAYPYEES